MEIYVSYYAVACVILRRIHWIATWVEWDLRKYNDNACYAGWTNIYSLTAGQARMRKFRNRMNARTPPLS